MGRQRRMARFCGMIWLMVSAYVSAQGNGGETGVLHLETEIQGNQEQPKVLYVIPWEAPSGPGELDPLGRHRGNVFERAFAPVERPELQRQLDGFSSLRHFNTPP